jgi:hypothetical protein
MRAITISSWPASCRGQEILEEVLLPSLSVSERLQLLRKHALLLLALRQLVMDVAKSQGVLVEVGSAWPGLCSQVGAECVKLSRYARLRGTHAPCLRFVKARPQQLACLVYASYLNALEPLAQCCDLHLARAL